MKIKPITPEKKKMETMITNQEFANLYNCLNEILNITIKKNIGTAKAETLVLRGWNNEQIKIFITNKRKLQEHFTDLTEQEKALAGRREKVAKQFKQLKLQETLSETDKKELDDIVLQLTTINEQHRALFDTCVPLPEMVMIKNSEIKDFEFTGNNYMSAFWQYLVDLDT